MNSLQLETGEFQFQSNFRKAVFVTYRQKAFVSDVSFQRYALELYFLALLSVLSARYVNMPCDSLVRGNCLRKYISC